MNDIKVLLVCGAGISSGLLAQNARKAAKKRGINAFFEARSESEAPQYFRSIDLLLLGPHYANYKAQMTEMAKPYNVVVEVIPTEIFGLMDGEKLLDIVLLETAQRTEDKND